MTGGTEIASLPAGPAQATPARPAAPASPASPQAAPAPTTITAGPDGPKITVGADGKMTIISPDGSTTIVAPDGRVLTHITNEGEVSQPSSETPIIHQGMDEGAVVSILAISVVTAFLLGRWRGRLGERRRGRERAPAGVTLPADLGERIDRIEHAVDSVAVEVERISEGQRFTTKLMSEMRPAPAASPQLPAAQPEPAPLHREAAATAPVSDRRS